VQRQRGQRVDAAKRAQPRDGRPQSLVGGQPGQALIERFAARGQPVDG
jgi:hypothetical protein